MSEQLRNMVFRLAYQDALRETQRAWLGYSSKAYDHEYRRRQRNRVRRRKR